MNKTASSVFPASLTPACSLFHYCSWQIKKFPLTCVHREILCGNSGGWHAGHTQCGLENWGLCSMCSHRFHKVAIPDPKDTNNVHTDWFKCWSYGMVPKGLLTFLGFFLCSAEFSPCWELPEYIRELIHLAYLRVFLATPWVIVCRLYRVKWRGQSHWF